MAEEQNKLREGISYFEQILQMMPNDRATLEFLCIAYEQVGDREKHRQTLLSLVNVIVHERDLEGARKLLESLSGNADSETQALEQKVRAMLTPMMGIEALKTVGPEPESEQPVRQMDSIAAVKAEVRLAGWLEANGLIDKEMADRVCDQLTALGKVSDEILISALAVLENENPGLAETAAAAVADESHTPPISLELFDQYLTQAKSLPERLVKVRGAIPFGKVADEMLVALANPMDHDLKADIETILGVKCHFFFVPPLSLGLVLSHLFPEESK